jgi:hypothetical protein
MDNKIQEEEQSIVIDFQQLNNEDVNEAFQGVDRLALFAPHLLGGWIKNILGSMFGGPSIPLTVRGTPGQVKSFAAALQKEKRYIEAYNKYGLNDPNVHRSKAKLQVAVGNFERATGLKWPFK